MRHLLKTAVAAVLLCAAGASAANAKGLRPGHWYLYDAVQGAYQEICLLGTLSEGTWYGTTFNWSGRWQNTVIGTTKTGHLWSSYNSGTAASSIIALGSANSKWNDWLDDQSYYAALNHVQVTRIGGICPTNAQNAKINGPATAGRK